MRLAILSVWLLAMPTWAQSEATYSVTFVSTWTASSHPDGFPNDPHFSGWVGATHTSGTHLWQSGGKASNGVELMAETGAQAPLRAEADALRGSGEVQTTLSGDGIGSPGSTSMTFSVTESHPYISLVSMLAPSPDWFVGVDGLALRDGDEWISEIVVPLDVYDAGTDSGMNYTSPDEDTDPASDIVKIEGSPFTVGDVLVPVGTFTFSLQTVTANESTLPVLRISAAFPNPANSFTALAVTRPDASPISVEVFDGLGRLVSSQGVPKDTGPHTIRMNTEGWAPGVYHARVATASAVVTRRFVIQQ